LKRFTRAEIENKVLESAAEVICVDRLDVTLISNFVTDLCADSLDQVELIEVLEGQLGLDIPDEDAEELQTVQQTVDYIFDRVGKG